MRVYPDANIYVSYLLGDAQEELAEEFFNKSASCRYEIVVSKVTFGEIQHVCGDRAGLLMQKHLNEFEKNGKIINVEKTDEDRKKALELNEKTNRKFGINDFLHAILAGQHADMLVTNDLEFKETASRIVRTLTLKEFLAEIRFYSK